MHIRTVIAAFALAATILSSVAQAEDAPPAPAAANQGEEAILALAYDDLIRDIDPRIAKLK